MLSRTCKAIASSTRPARSAEAKQNSQTRVVKRSVGQRFSPSMYLQKKDPFCWLLRLWLLLLFQILGSDELHYKV
jgi:hypothetical protein